MALIPQNHRVLDRARRLGVVTMLLGAVVLAAGRGDAVPLPCDVVADGAVALERSSVDAAPGDLAERTASVTARRPHLAGREVLLTRAEIRHVLDQSSFVIISAGRNASLPADAALAPAALRARHDGLRAELERMGYRFTTLEGHYGGMSEASFLVYAAVPEHAAFVELGARYRQDSIILADRGRQELVFTSGLYRGRRYRGAGWVPVADATKDHSVAPLVQGESILFRFNFDFDSLQ